MFPSKVIFKFLVLLCATKLQDVNAKVEFVRKSHIFPGKEVLYNYHSIENEYIVFAVCEGQDEKKNCTIVHQNYPYDEITRSCNLSINLGIISNADLPGEFFYMDVRPLGKDKALMIWRAQPRNSNASHVKLATLQMSDCQTSENQLHDNSIYFDLYSYDLIVARNDSYDLFLKGKNPFGNAIRQLRVDSQTGSIEELDSHMENVEKLVQVFSIDSRSPTKGYVYKETDDETFTHDKDWLIKFDGSRILLQSHNMFTMASTMWSVNNAIVICNRYKNESRIECMQYDGNGKVQLRAVLKGLKNVTSIESMHISPYGGLLLLLGIEENARYVDYRVIRVDTKGKVVGRLRLSEFDNCANSEWAGPHIYDKGDGKYCITLPCRSHEQRLNTKLRYDVLDIAAYCFTEDDLVMHSTNNEFIN